MRAMGPNLRLVAGAALFGLWLYLFLLGRTAGGAIHLLLPAALALVPWKSAAPGADRKEPSR